MNDITKLIRSTATSTTPVATPIPAPRKTEVESDESLDKARYYKRTRAPLNFIPSAEDLQRMVERALTALSKGVYWDRGSINNLIL